MLPLTITDNYILITSDEEIKEGEWQLDTKNRLSRFSTISMNLYGESYKKVIAHLPITDSADLRGVPLLPPLPSGEDSVEKLACEELGYNYNNWIKFHSKDASTIVYQEVNDWKKGYNKAKEKYRFTEVDMRKAIELSYSKGLAKPNSGRLSDIPNVQNEIIQSLSQQKMPTSFSPNMVCDQCNGDESTDSCYCHHGSYKIVPQIINGAMQGEWIF